MKWSFAYSITFVEVFCTNYHSDKPCTEHLDYCKNKIGKLKN